MIPRFLLAVACVCGLGFSTADAADSQAATAPVATDSPDGRVRVNVFLDRAGAARSVPHYRITWKNRPIILASPLRVSLADGSTLGDDCTIEGVQTREINTTYRHQPGKRSQVIDRCRETIVSLRESGGARRAWQVVVRAYDNGVALRYHFPQQDGWPQLVLASEKTVFSLPEAANCFALPLNSFTTSHEGRYKKTAVRELPADWLLALPLLLELPGSGWAAITEANLTDYAGMYLAPVAPGKGELICRLSPLPKEPAVAVRASLPHDSPWRVVMLAEEPGSLIESDLILNLNAPCAIEDVTWIQSGKTTFPWWNGFFEQNTSFKPGLNTATAKYYIDFCAEAGIPYHSLDGVDNKAWYGGPIVPYEGAPITAGVAGLDLPEVLRHAKVRGVRIRLWMHWQAAQAHMAQAFPLYRAWGIEGVMIDFMDRDDQDMVNFMRDVLTTAAANRLTVTFHGCPKPTGLERTYPNLLTSEGVLNLEYDKWDPIGVPPEHEVTIPFTRMLAGPLDFHQGSFRTVAVNDFKPRNEAPLIMGTPCRTLASYVVFENHLPMVADYPSAYRGHPALGVLAAIPTTWDDTKVISGAVGEWVAIARRHGDQWWVGVMTNRQSRELPLPLGFLGAGRFSAELYRDDPAADHRLTKEIRQLTAQDTIVGKFVPAGGLLIHLTPVGGSR